MGKKTSRRGFLKYVGVGSAAAAGAALPKTAKAGAPKCSCPVQSHDVHDAFGGSGHALTLHISKECPVHSERAAEGCGVYECDWDECHNPRTHGLPPQKHRSGDGAIDFVYGDGAADRMQRSNEEAQEYFRKKRNEQ